MKNNIQPHPPGRVEVRGNHQVIGLHRSVYFRNKATNAASAFFRPRISTCGEGVDSLLRATQSHSDLFATIGVGDRSKVERPDDCFDKQLGIGPAIQVHVRRGAQDDKSFLQRSQFSLECTPLSFGKRTLFRKCGYRRRLFRRNQKQL